MTAPATTAPEPIRVVLSGAELRVLDELLSDGPTNLELAARLSNSEDTIKTHLKSVMRKTGTTNRTELVVAVMRRKVVVYGPTGRRTTSAHGDLA